MRLVDCFAETMAFTLHFLERVEHSQPPYEEIEAQYRELIAKAKDRCEDEELRPAEQDAALFAICAWVDESVLVSSWKEKERWQASPLQVTHFGTWNGGEEFFSRLAALNEGEDQAREVYDYCLSVGFKGSLFRPDDCEALERITGEQKAKVEGRRPALPHGALLFPLSYGEAQKRRMRYLNLTTPSLVGLGVAVPVLLFVVLLFLYRYILDSTLAAYVH